MTLILKGDPGEVPGTFWFPADLSNYRQRPQAQPHPYEIIIIHITSGHPSPYGTASMFAKPQRPPRSAHFVVGRDPLTILQCVPLRFAAQHAHKLNSYSVAIEHCAREPKELNPNDPGLFPTPEQYLLSAKLSAYLLKAAGLPVIKGITIEGHAKADTRTTHTNCPDAVWDWDYYLPLVKSEYAKLPQISILSC